MRGQTGVPGEKQISSFIQISFSQKNKAKKKQKKQNKTKNSETVAWMQALCDIKGLIHRIVPSFLQCKGWMSTVRWGELDAFVSVVLRKRVRQLRPPCTSFTSV